MCNGIHNVDPVDRKAPSPEVNRSAASEALPVKANTQPCAIIPIAFQKTAPLSPATAASSSASSLAAP